MNLRSSIILFSIVTASNLFGFGKSQAEPNNSVRVLADLHLLQNLGIKTESQNAELNLATATISSYQALGLSHFAHRYHKCGGFEDITPTALSSNSLFKTDEDIFTTIQDLHLKNNHYSQFSVRKQSIIKNEKIETALSLLSEDNLRNTVQWMSQIPSRYHKSEEGKKAVNALTVRLKELIQKSGRTDITIEEVAHVKTPQTSVRATIKGYLNPDEIVVLGGHFDSIATWGYGNAPGADDNASGSSNVLEAFRVFLLQNPPQRTVEFYWYAGEEAGLLGSAEIAAHYKSLGKKVISVMQLDMTLFPGEGEGVIGDMTDFTSVWLRDVVKELNTLYVGARFKEDKCGYGCSDHASWYKNGYPTVVPFEATMNTMNDNIHTRNDVISPALNFKHSLTFTQLGLAYVMELSNTELKQPY